MRSLWLNGNAPPSPVQPLDGDKKTTALVIGGGMAGVLCAYRLTELGIPNILVEAGRIGMGTTGHTTAKITGQHRLLYAKMIRKSGIDAARQYYQANESAIAQYRQLAGQFPCDFEEKDAFIYSTGDRRKLDEEAAAYERLGIPSRIDESPPLPLRTVGALCMERQAQFHPTALLSALSGALTIYQDTFVSRIDGNKAVTERGTITAEHIILATHYPLVNIPGAYFIKLYQHRSYVVALQNAKELGGMYLDENESGFSFRNYRDMLLLGGGSHRTGYPGEGYAALRRLAASAYPDARERYAWSTQDCMTLDGLPYIGIHRSAKTHLYVATGFNKWGMTGSMVAATLLSDLIARGRSELQALYSPQRGMLHPQLLRNILSASIGYIGLGRRCPHMGCALRWNSAEKTWDCPCHGSRFSEGGSLLEGPAKKRLFYRKHPED